ncbi:MAG: type IV pili methyl-accepting chemotaxis transducer N-terminal domain-containing protein [Betaproteobacteria bacterium]|nr:type IV pili methyl-accepting chemotaxis transducer N-terminal domain-containing protein [Betaproteobacteria bacterium]
MLRSIWLLVLCLAALPAQAAGDAEAINLAGQQRMLSQRIVKSWCQIGLNVQPGVSKRQLDESLRRFEDNLKALEGVAAGSEARGALAGLRAAWAPLRTSALGVIRQADAALLDARAEDVLMAAERLTRALQDQSAAPVSRWVNLAGRQRMLSQRLVKVYMLRQWGVDNARLRDELDSVQNEFSGALASMQQRAGNSAAVREEVDKLALQWEWLRTALATEGAESFRLILAEGGDAVLELADQVTLLYQQSAP